MKHLAISAISREAVEAVFLVSSETRKDLILSVDTYQVSNRNSYLMSSKEFESYIHVMKVKYPKARVILLRKNAGPGFNCNTLKDFWSQLEVDSKSFYDIIHFNYTNLRLPLKDTYIKVAQAIKFSQSQNQNLRIEIGHSKLQPLSVHKEASLYVNHKPLFCTIDTGTSVKDGVQKGKLNDLRIPITVLRGINIPVKETNSDFLTPDEIRFRRDTFDCLEIGSELAIKQNDTFLRVCTKDNLSYEKLASVALQNKSWKKLLDIANPDDGNLCLALTGHWYINTLEGQKLWKKVQSTHNRAIIDDLANIVDRYRINFL